jgi:DNA-binding IclR family transcriptional regulator
VLEVGSRRPLGAGAAGLAILAAIDDEERTEVIERVTTSLPPFGHLTARAVAEACVTTRERGVALIKSTISLGVSAVSMPFRNPMNQPIGALSVAALSQRMTAARLSTITGLLRSACVDVEQRLRARKRAGWEAGAHSSLKNPRFADQNTG